MAGSRIPGPLCSTKVGLGFIDAGSNCRTRSPQPGPVCSESNNNAENALRRNLRELESEALNFGGRFVNDGAVRRSYVAAVRKMSEETIAAFRAGEITAEEGARLAQGMRDNILQSQRAITSDIGLAIAQKEKLRSPNLPELQEKYARKLFGQEFESLVEHQRGKVFAAIIEASGRARPSYVVLAARLARIGRGLEVLTVGIAVYNIAAAEDKLEAAAKETATASGGILGGAAGGALAGLACGPGAPVCVTIGVFLGGALGAFGFGSLFERVHAH